MTYLEKNSIIIKQICENESELGKKKLKKFMYLIERKGVNLGLNYSIHYFGPYSSKLDNTMHILESDDKIVINTSRITHTIHLGEEPIEGNLEDNEQEAVNFVLSKFKDKSAYDLEAITTLDYVATEMLNGEGSDEQIIDKVKQIKGTKFTKEHLESNLKLLKQLEYVWYLSFVIKENLAAPPKLTDVFMFGGKEQKYEK